MAAAKATTEALDSTSSSKKTLKIENTDKRDTLIAIEKKYQEIWQETKVFEADAPSISEISLDSISAADLRRKHPKFFGTMAYPYMNGTLHAGHTFTMSKIEFQAGFARMEGRNALFPLGFHCTGMPIKACADKLVREVEMFGTEFERCPTDEITEGGKDQHDVAPAPTQGATKEDITKFSATKSKAAAKTVKMKYQFQIMLAIGIPLKEIHRFADPQYWLTFFPPLCQRDMNNFGARVDWRRSMVTTDANPYYDAFVRWQMNRLKELGKIKFDKRYTVYSPKDGQPCMDHDRAEGEGVTPQEYTALKQKVIEWAPEAKKIIDGKVPNSANIYFVPATLRPETMYGQTCCFVGPKITYGIFQASPNEFYVITERAARNMAFQGIFEKWGQEISPVVTFLGSAVIGTLVHAPLSIHTQGVRILPMETVSAAKGTGVVTSVPSDSPDDYATVSDLAKKAEYYGIKKEWAELEILPIIKTESYGDLTAPFLVKKMKINSPKDTKQLAEAKEAAYKEGFYKGTILVGEFKGEKVEIAKEKVRRQLIDAGDAFEYAEPNGRVVSRSADECVVAFLDQWFLNYGKEDAEWQKLAMDYVSADDGLMTFTTETKNQFLQVLDWLNRWACARTYGLGSKLPWDPHFLVESLSDSTIYMSYYTIAHLLHLDIFGKSIGPANIKPEQMIDEVWDYIYCRRELSDDVIKSSGIPRKTLEILRREFSYWYPLDVRVSGKDLIPNHLTFFLYIHLALFPREYWPKAIRANGHLLLNGEKMSKSTGNFMTLDEIVKKYGADASRIALADAGDGIEDANFEEAVANSSILRLHTLKEWCEEMISGDSSNLRTGPSDGFWDKLFENEMRGLVQETRKHYESTNYKLALKTGFYDFCSARDFYREATGAAGVGMHRDLVLRYIELQALLITPIAPHWAEYAWLEILKKPSTIQKALYPTVPPVDPALSAARDYVRTTTSNITSAEAAQQKKKDKGKAIAFDPRKPKKLTIYAAAAYPSWQDKYIDMVREAFDAVSIHLNEKELNPKVAKMGEMKKAMPFVQSLKKRLLAGEKTESVFDRKLPFEEFDTLKQMVPALKRTTGCKAIEVIAVEEGGKTGKPIKEDGGFGDELSLNSKAEAAIPGQPVFDFENIDA